jgi:hypothetical protein
VPGNPDAEKFGLSAEIPGVGEITVMGRPDALVADGSQGGTLAIAGAEGLIAVIGGNGLSAIPGAGATSIGLTPPLPISKEPNGIPGRATPPGVVGDVAAKDEPLLPDVVPPGIAAPAPISSPPPSYVVLEPDIPDAGLPVAALVMPLPVIPIMPPGNGLSPGDASSVAPRGIPVGGTDEPGIMPSGDVAPMLGATLPVPPTCAKADAQLNNTADAAIIAKRVMTSSTSNFAAFIAPASPLTDNAMKYPDMAPRGLRRLVRCCVDRRTRATTAASLMPAGVLRCLARYCQLRALHRVPTPFDPLTIQAVVVESPNEPSASVRQQSEAYECLDRSRIRMTHRANKPPTVSTISGANSA